jgi:type VI secretion system protein ImpL
MKQTLIKILKFCLYAAVLVLIALLVFGVVYSLDWPWWAGGFILVGLVGLAIGVVFLIKIWRRRREQLFVSEMVEQDEAYLKGVEAKERERLQELQGKWKEALETLKHSHLKKLGNPLYVLPWYMVIGESGSGKTTALTSARLSSPFAEISRTSGISGTRNCDWWFFEQAIVIDTAGRYAIPIDEGKDKEEWQKFLGLLIKYRKREALNGLVVTVSADKLLQAGAEALEEDGRDIRRRIDELMRVLGARFPVYVLVSKCDLVQGMTQFCDKLPEKSLDQAMGCVNQDIRKDVLPFGDRAVDGICDHLRDFRLWILHQSGSKSIDPSFLIFPEEFDKLKPGLGAFIKGAFTENPYQETPVLRGVFFSSGRQEGAPYSHFLRALGLIEERDVLPGTSKGLFLHDFFSKVLPRDRHLFAPTKRTMEWQRLSRNLGLTSWIALGVALCGLLSLSFVKNLQTLRVVSHEFMKPPTLTGEFVADVMTMERFCSVILKVEEENRNWWIPRFGLTESLRVEDELKNRYCEQFQKGFLVSFDRAMEAKMSQFSGGTPDLVVAQCVEHLVRRINVIRARMDGKELEELRKKPQPSYELMLTGARVGSLGDLKGEFGDLYLYYLIWRRTSADLGQEMNVLQTWLKRILTMKEKDLRWLVAWVNHQDSLSDVALDDFWKGSKPLAGKVMVARTFTRDGKEKLDGFMAEIDEALPDPLLISGRKQDFLNWYRETYLSSWHSFAADFHKGIETLKGRAEWQRSAAKMASDEGPYFAVLNKMPLELEPMVRDEKLPSWMVDLYRWELIKAQSAAEHIIDDKGIVGKVVQKGKQMVSGVDRQVSALTGKHVQLSKETVTAYQDFLKALQQIVPVAESRKLAFELAGQTFSADPAVGQTPFLLAYKSFNHCKTSSGTEKTADETVWKLAKGPVDFLWSFVCYETSCALQKDWEEKVLAEVQGVSDQTAQELLLAQDGLAWKYVKGAAAPFIERSLKAGYSARETLSRKIPFDQAFFTYLSQGAVQKNVMREKEAKLTKSQYPVVIEGLPTGANPESPIKPKATHLRMECDSGSQVMDNYNYPASKVFNWTPETCTEVTLVIDVENLTLTRRYGGPDAFPRFLREFQGGQRVFRSSEFPAMRSALEGMGITYIDVRYRFKGHGEILGVQSQPQAAAPRKAPREIVKCWD